MTGKAGTRRSVVCAPPLVLLVALGARVRAGGGGRQLGEAADGCTVPTARGGTGFHSNCTALDVCSGNFLAHQEGVGGYGVVHFEPPDHPTAAGKPYGCSLTISARPGQHVELIFTQRFPPPRDTYSLTVVDPGLLRRNLCKGLNRCVSVACTNDRWLTDCAHSLFADSLVNAPNNTRLWPNDRPAAVWRGVSSGYQVIVQAGGENHPWELAWAAMDGSCTDGTQGADETGVDCGGQCPRPSCSAGCTNTRATNYNPSANVDDGSCTFTFVPCNDPVAQNFNPSASCGYQGSCSYTACGSLASALGHIATSRLGWQGSSRAPRCLGSTSIVVHDAQWGLLTQQTISAASPAAELLVALIAAGDSVEQSIQFFVTAHNAAVFLQGDVSQPLFRGSVAMTRHGNNCLIVRYLYWGDDGEYTHSTEVYAAIELGGSFGGVPAFVSHCTFEGIRSSSPGGAISLYAQSVLIVEHCVFLGCSAPFGGAIAAQAGSTLVVEHSAFARNFAVQSRDPQSGNGGAIYAEQSTPNLPVSVKISGSRFEGNGIAKIVPAYDAGALIGGQAMKLTTVHDWSINSTIFIPYDEFDTVYLSGSGSLNCNSSPCDAGGSCAVYNSSIWCTTCTRSQVSADGIECTNCPAGLEPNVNSTQCVACAPGQFTDEGKTAARCQVCPGHSIAAADGTHCEACPPFSVANVGGTSCQCHEGRYNVSEGTIFCFESDFDEHALDLSSNQMVREELTEGEICVSCPSCATCVDGSVLINSGYGILASQISASNLSRLTGSGRSRSLFRCEAEEHCDHSSGGSLCPAGNTGPLCALCESGFGRFAQGDSCAKCDYGYQGYITGGVISLLLAVFVVWPLWAVSKQWRRQTVCSNLTGRASDNASRCFCCCFRGSSRAQPLLDDSVRDRANNPIGSFYVEADTYRLSQAMRTTTLHVPVDPYVTVSTERQSRLVRNLARLLFQPIKILLTFAQVLGALGSVLHLQMPNFMRSIADAAKAFVFDVRSFIQLECWTAVEFYALWLFKVFVVPMMLLLAVEVHFRAEAIAISTQRNENRHHDQHQQRNENRYSNNQYQRHRTWRFFVLFLVYPTICTQTFGLFNCRRLEWMGREVSLLIENYDVSCDSTTHAVFSVLSGAIIVSVVIGVPVFCAVLLFQQRRERNRGNADDVCRQDPAYPTDYEAIARKVTEQCSLGDSEKVNKTIIHDIWFEKNNNFLMDSFRSDYFYWESIDLSRKAILTGAIVLFGRGSVAQIFLALLISFAFFTAQMRFAPYRHMEDNMLKCATEAQIFVTILVALITSHANLESEAWQQSVYNVILQVLFYCLVPGAFVVTVFVKHKHLIAAEREFKSTIAEPSKELERSDLAPPQVALNRQSNLLELVRAAAMKAQIRGDATDYQLEVLRSYVAQLWEERRKETRQIVSIVDAAKTQQGGSKEWAKSVLQAILNVHCTCTMHQWVNPLGGHDGAQQRWKVLEVDSCLPLDGKPPSDADTFIAYATCNDHVLETRVEVKAYLSARLKENFVALKDSVMVRARMEVAAMHLSQSEKDGSFSSIRRCHHSFVDVRQTCFCMVLETVDQSAAEQYSQVSAAEKDVVHLGFDCLKLLVALHERGWCFRPLKNQTQPLSLNLIVRSHANVIQVETPTPRLTTSTRRTVAIICSAPERSLDGTKVMETLEERSKADPNIYIGYDWKGSSSASQADVAVDWSNPDSIERSQWFYSYKARVKSQLMIKAQDGIDMIEMVTIAGGPTSISQVESLRLPGIKDEAIADMQQKRIQVPDIVIRSFNHVLEFLAECDKRTQERQNADRLMHRSSLHRGTSTAWIWKISDASLLHRVTKIAENGEAMPTSAAHAKDDMAFVARLMTSIANIGALDDIGSRPEKFSPDTWKVILAATKLHGCKYDSAAGFLDELQKSTVLEEGYFLSHVQKFGGTWMADLKIKLSEKLGPILHERGDGSVYRVAGSTEWRTREGSELCWLDLDEVPTERGMKEGVLAKKNFLLFLTEGYFDSKFCMLELREALRLNRNIVLVQTTANRGQGGVSTFYDYIKEAEKKANVRPEDKDNTGDWAATAPRSVFQTAVAIPLHSDQVGRPFVDASIDSILAAADYSSLQEENLIKDGPSSVALGEQQRAVIWADTEHTGDYHIAGTILSNLRLELPQLQNERLELCGPQQRFHFRKTATYNAQDGEICDIILGSSIADNTDGGGPSLLLLYLTERTLELPETLTLARGASHRKWRIIALREMDERDGFGKVSDEELHGHSSWHEFEQYGVQVVPYFKEKRFRTASMRMVLELWLSTAMSRGDLRRSGQFSVELKRAATDPTMSSS